MVSGMGMRLGMWLVAWASHTELLTLGPNSLIISFSSAACMDFLRCNLSPLLLFSHTNDVVTNLAMIVTLINMFFYCTTSKRTLLQWRMASVDLPGIMFVGFFGEKCLLAISKYIMVIPARIVCRGSI